VTFTLPSAVSLSAGNYAIHLQLGAGSSPTGYHWAREYDANDPYPAGISGYWYPYVGGRWVTTVELDDTFRVYGCEPAAQGANVPAMGSLGFAVFAILLVGIGYLGTRRRART
jgi:hypothetical protein